MLKREPEVIMNDSLRIPGRLEDVKPHANNKETNIVIEDIRSNFICYSYHNHDSLLPSINWYNYQTTNLQFKVQGKFLYTVKSRL